MDSYRIFTIVMLYTHLVVLHAFVAWVAYWEMGGRHEFCFGSDAVLSEELCRLLNSEWFLLSLFIFLLWVTFLSVMSFLRIHNDFKEMIYQELKYAWIPALLILVLGFYEFRFCLGLLGCNSIYFWPYTTSFVLAYFMLVWIRIATIDRSNYFVKRSIIVRVINLSLYIMFTIAYVYIAGSAISYLANIDLNLEKRIVPTKVETLDGRSVPFSNQVQTGTRLGTFLLAEQEFVEVAIVEADGKSTPTYLQSATESGHRDKVYSNTRSYYIKNGIIYAGFGQRMPFEYQIYATKTGFTDLSFTGNGEIISVLHNIPVVVGTTMVIPVTQEDGTMHLWEVIYDFDTNDSHSSEKISWKKEFNFVEQSLDLINLLIKDSSISDVEKVGLIEMLSIDSYNNKQMISKLLIEYITASSEYNVDEKIRTSRDLAAGLILELL